MSTFAGAVSFTVVCTFLYVLSLNMTRRLWPNNPPDITHGRVVVCRLVGDCCYCPAITLAVANMTRPHLNRRDVTLPERSWCVHLSVTNSFFLKSLDIHGNLSTVLERNAIVLTVFTYRWFTCHCKLDVKCVVQTLTKYLILKFFWKVINLSVHQWPLFSGEVCI